VATQSVVRQLSALIQRGPVGDVSDGQLLERFSTRTREPDGLAFTVLVERHGQDVLQICRSVLRDEHAAHDAFQVTFLVLVKKARTLHVRDSLGPWLHSVAYRVALCSRSAEARRRKHERRGAERAAKVSNGIERTEADVHAVIHEEVARLPEHYRVPIVLCDLEGRTHEQVARQLGWPLGTVKSRQVRGRERLKQRLIGRGLAPTAALGLVAALAGPARAAVPRALVDATTRAAVGFASGAGPSTGATLTREVLMMIFLSRLRVLGPTLLALLLTTGAAFALVGQASSATRTPEQAPAPAPPPKPRETRIFLSADAGVQDAQGRKFVSLVAIDPKTGDWLKQFDDCGHRPRVAPGGKVIAFERGDAFWTWNFAADPAPTRVLDLEGTTSGSPAVWSPDGKQLIISRGRRDEAKEGWLYKTVRVNADGTGLEDLKIPPEDGVADWSSDGKWLLTASSRGAKIGWQLYVMHPDGTEQRRITEDGNPFYARFSPDGRRVIYSDMARKENRGIWMVDSDGKNRHLVLPFDRDASPAACWSPDGKQIAITLWTYARGNQPAPEPKIIVMDLDGGKLKEYPTPNRAQVSDMPDWR
jgi:RNA polymerase sigma factor (sigma-70 family)